MRPGRRDRGVMHVGEAPRYKQIDHTTSGLIALQADELHYKPKVCSIHRILSTSKSLLGYHVKCKLTVRETNNSIVFVVLYLYPINFLFLILFDEFKKFSWIRRALRALDLLPREAGEQI